MSKPQSMKNRLQTLRQRLHWHSLLLPVWRRLSFPTRRRLIWAGTAKFIVGVAGICINPRGHILLLHHRFHNENPWGFPGGWMDRGETPQQAMLRELREETGYTPTQMTLLSTDGDGVWIELVYICHVPDATPVLQATEHSRYLWADPAHLPVILTASQQKAVTLYLRRLNKTV